MHWADPFRKAFGEVRERINSLTVVLACAHVGMVLLHLIDRAAPAIAPRAGLPGVIGVVDEWWWVVAHTSAAVLLSLGVVFGSWRLGVWGACFGGSTWAIWMILLLAWSLNTVPPVSLVAPLLGLVVVVPLSVVLAVAWSEDGI